MTQNVLIDSFPLSPMQQGMLFHHLKEPHSGVDIQQLVVHLPESVDAPRLEAAWRWLVQRHDVLRARFVWEETGQPRQEILSDALVPFIVEDARHLAVSDQQAHLRAFLDSDRVQGVDLATAPMMRLKLIQWAPASYSLVWTFHHAILDGRCYPVLLQEVFAAYEELGSGGIGERPAPFPYRRYIDWLLQRDTAPSESYWRKTLAGYSAPTPLVVDRLAPAGSVIHQQGEAWDGLDVGTTAALRNLAARHAVTVNSFVMGAWAILLHRYSGEEDIVFGATRACRKSSVEHADETVGLFINTVPVRIRLAGEDRALSVIHALRRQWLEIRPHEHTPLTTAKAASRVPPAQPLFESLLVFENQRLDQAMRALGGAWSHRDVELHELTNFPVTLAAYDGERLSFKIEFNRCRLDEPTVRRVLGHLRRLLEGLAADPETFVCDLPLITEAEREELLHSFNATVDDSIQYETSLHGLFEEQVARRPDAVAVTFEGRSLTYRELNGRANQLAHHLKKVGVGPGVFVGLFLDRSFEMVVGLLGVLKAGAAYVPIDPEYPAERVAFMLRDAAAPVLLVRSRMAAELPPYHGTIVSLDDGWDTIARESTVNPPNSTAPGDLAYMIYTSGSTGVPKGAMNAHRGICNRLLWMQKQYRMSESDTVLQKTPFSFDVSVWEFFWPLIVGARLVMAKPGGHRDPAYLVDVIAREQISVMHFVPSMLGAFLAAPGLERCRSLRHVMCSGEALPFNLQEEFLSLLPAQLHNLYGPTEAAVDVTHWTCRPNDERKIVPIGRPVANTRIYLLDRHLRPVPIGVPGDLYIGGVQVGRGYHNRPELTAERFIPDHFGAGDGARLYKTGDLARYLPGGEIEYLGRVDHQVKIRGFRIELGEIEAALCRHPAIREAVVMAREDAPGIKRLAAYLVAASSEVEVDVDTVREHLKTSLPEFMVPAVFMVMDELPLSPNGKIDRKALPVPAQSRDSAGSSVAPGTATERKLAAIWSKVLRNERVGIHDNFFELGGDSILSIQAISLARREGLKITPTMLFANQTIAELAAVATVDEDLPPKEDSASGEAPLTPIQRWFFEQQLEESHHFNQAFLFEVVEPLDRGLLESALKEVSRHHDALRFRYRRDGQGWHQSYSPLDDGAVLQWVDLSRFEDGERRRQIESIAATAQGSLDLGQGPIWRVLYVQSGSDRSDRMLIVVHHLVVDGVSWRLLLEDLESVYRQLRDGRNVQLPAKTVSYKAWAERLLEFSGTDSLRNELPYWKAVTDPGQETEAGAAMSPMSGRENREGATKTLTYSLAIEETQALLKQVPAVYNTQINDVLLTALTRAWGRWSGGKALFTDLEGHGREEIPGGLDPSRTVGWFTSIYPVRLELPEAGSDWRPGEALKSVKEQLRRIPRRGVGYGILRYIAADRDLAAGLNAPMVFNYFGQFDQVLAGSTLFRFGKESTGPWHSPRQQRRYVFEINSLVIDGRFELRWTYNETLHREQEIQKLVEEYLAALRELIAHCRSPHAGGRTPSDFPLARLDQVSLDRLLSEQPDLEDVYPLSPIQTLFYSANPGGAGTAFDQWHCTLTGPLDQSAFQRAWQATIQHHSVLRSTIHGDGLREPMQVVHRDVRLPWTIQDWRGETSDPVEVRWLNFLKQDLSQPLKLGDAPVMRFTLIRIGEQRWKFAWSVPALLLDGWSWPLVFRDAGRLYESMEQGRRPQLDPVRPYRDYVEWLNRQPQDASRAFWRETLAGFVEPTPLPAEEERSGEAGKDRFAEYAAQLSAEATSALQSTARRLQVTLNTLVQGMWALFLSRQSGRSDVLFGASFSGRPTDLAGAESIVGPFVNNLPVRVAVDTAVTVGEFLRQVHGNLLQLSPYQFTPLVEIQRASEVPWRYRLFDSLVVFQNYLVDESARRFGNRVALSDFSGPIHTNYPVLLLAEPGGELRLTLVCDRKVVGPATRERWSRDLVRLFERLPDSLDRRAGDLQGLLSLPPAAAAGPARRFRTGSQQVVPPQSEMERTIAGVWRQMFGAEEISVDDNFFDLGGHSMLLVQMHGRLREVLGSDFPIVTLLEHPSIRSLAACFERPAASGAAESERLRERARKQKEAMDRSRSMARKR